MTRSLRILRCAAVVALGAFGPSLPADAQLVLGQVPGQTTLENRMGNSVNRTCGGLGAAGANTAGPTAADDLFARCTEMVLNANVIVNGGPSTGSGVASLGLTSGQLNDALLQLSDYAGGAIGPSGTQAAFVQVASLGQRLLALREGATGWSVAGLFPRGLQDAEGVPDAGAALLGSVSGLPDVGAVALPAGLGVFVTGHGDILHYGGSDELLGFDDYGGGVTVGVDYRFLENLVAGLAFGWTGSSADFQDAGSNLDANSYVPSVYASYTHGGFYADGIFSYAYDTFDLSRRIVYPTVNRTAEGDTDANEFSFSLGGGYEFDLKDVVEGLTAGPRIRYDYLHQDVASFEESGARGLNLRYRDVQIESSVLAVGFETAYAVSTGFGVLTPQLRFDYNHEFAAQPQRIEATFIADPNQFVFFVRPDYLDRDFFKLGVGLAATLQHGVSAFIDWETLLGYDDVQSNVIHVGARYEF